MIIIIRRTAFVKPENKLQKTMICARQRRSGGCALGDDPARFHAHQLIGHVEIAVVVGDDDDGFAQAFEVRQQLGVEDAAEGRWW